MYVYTRVYSHSLTSSLRKGSQICLRAVTGSGIFLKVQGRPASCSRAATQPYQLQRVTSPAPFPGTSTALVTIATLLSCYCYSPLSCAAHTRLMPFIRSQTIHSSADHTVLTNTHTAERSCRAQIRIYTAAARPALTLSWTATG